MDVAHQHEFTNCQSCTNKAYCLLSEDCSLNLSKINLHKQDRSLSRKDKLFMENENVHYAYILKQGLVKTFSISEKGDIIIMGLYYPGDIVALDCLQREKYFYYAEVVEDAIVCQVDKEIIIEKLHATDYLSKQICRQKSMFRVLSKLSVKEKVAYFLMKHSHKLGSLGYPLEHFSLGFTRIDIANYLGVTVEAISRALGAYKENGILTNKASHFTIINRKKLADSCTTVPLNLKQE